MVTLLPTGALRLPVHLTMNPMSLFPSPAPSRSRQHRPPPPLPSMMKPTPSSSSMTIPMVQHGALVQSRLVHHQLTQHSLPTSRPLSVHSPTRSSKVSPSLT